MVLCYISHSDLEWAFEQQGNNVSLMVIYSVSIKRNASESDNIASFSMQAHNARHHKCATQACNASVQHKRVMQERNAN